MKKNEDWTAALGSFTYGIYVLTSAHAGQMNGMIASWVSQVSGEPLLVMVAVHHNRYSHGLIEKSGKFAIHSLAKDRKDFLQRFKGPDRQAKFRGLGWIRGKTGCPILNDCLSCLECSVVDRFDPGNHTLFFGRVQAVHRFAQGPPLTTEDYDGVYLGRI